MGQGQEVFREILALRDRMAELNVERRKLEEQLAELKMGSPIYNVWR